MHIRTILVAGFISTTLVGVIAGPLMSQEAVPSHPVNQLVQKIDSDDLKGLIIMALVFGSGLIAAALFGLAAIVKAVRGNSPEVEELNDRLNAIEGKLDILAKHSGIPTDESHPDSDRQAR